MSAPTILTKEQALQAIQVCGQLADFVGDDDQHPLFPIMCALMNSIENWEDTDPELCAFFTDPSTASNN